MLNGQPLNEQQKNELNGHVAELPVIKELKAQDEEILDDLEGLKKGQAQLDQKVDTGFEKGRKRMDGIEDKVDNLKDLVTNLHHDVINAIKDKENQQLKEDISKMVKDREKEENRLWDVVKMVIAIMLGAGAAYLGLK